MIAATQSNHPLGEVSSPGERDQVGDARTHIRRAQLRITKPRIAIIESLKEHKGPISIERIHQEIGEDVCDLVTVYRCLSIFETHGIVRRSYLHNGTCLYELTVGTVRNYHIICKSCGQTEHVDYFPVEGIKRMLEDRGYAEVSHVVEFFGLCPACQPAVPVRESAPPAVASRVDTPASADSAGL